MKKFLMLLAATTCLSLAACQTPAGTNPTANPSGSASPATGSGGVSNALSTKAQFVAFLNCVKSNPSLTAEGKAAIDQEILALNSINDAQWAYVSASLSTYINLYSQYYKC